MGQEPERKTGGDPTGRGLLRPSLAEASEIQRRGAASVRLVDERDPRSYRLVGGCDCAYARRPDGGLRVCAVAVVLGRDEAGRPVPAGRFEAVREATFPYVPGYLSFRELPALAEAVRRAREALPVEAWIVDGAGLAHPRRFGLACHLGVHLDLVSVGCAKSRLWGRHEEPGPEAGDRADLRDGEERIGLVLRNRSGVRPLFVSPGHRISLEGACALVRAWTTRTRLPEPTRIADKETKRLARRIRDADDPGAGQRR